MKRTTAKKLTSDIDATKRLMAALGRMPPKPHDQMKIEKPRAKMRKNPVKRKSKQALSG